MIRISDFGFHESDPSRRKMSIISCVHPTFRLHDTQQKDTHSSATQRNTTFS